MKTFTLAAMIAASLAAAPAFAQAGSPSQVVISQAGLDLSTAEGRASLDLRVLRAARTVCGTPSPADLRGRSKAEDCVAEVSAAATARRDAAIAVAARQAQPVLASR